MTTQQLFISNKFYFIKIYLNVSRQGMTIIIPGPFAPPVLEIKKEINKAALTLGSSSNLNERKCLIIISLNHNYDTG